jgi:hypothetical protein
MTKGGPVAESRLELLTELIAEAMADPKTDPKHDGASAAQRFRTSDEDSCVWCGLEPPRGRALPWPHCVHST